DGSGAIVVALDLHRHEAVVEHSDGRELSFPLTPDRPVAEVTRDLLEGVGSLAGPVRINPKPQEVPWETPLDEDTEHRTYDPDGVSVYLAAATQAALVLAEFRAPYRGRASRVNAWWGTFDLAVVLYSGKPADPPADDFLTRNGGDAEAYEIGLWPGDRNREAAAFYAFAYPMPDGYSEAELSPGAAHWDGRLGEFVLDWEDIRSEPDPHALGLEFASSAFEHTSAVCAWDPFLEGSA